MKKFVIAFVIAIVSCFAANAQYRYRYTPRYVPRYTYRHYYTNRYYTPNYSSNIVYPHLNDKERGVRFSWPVDFAFSLGRTFVNSESPEYGGYTLNKDYFVFGAKICGFIFTFGSHFDITDEKVLGYYKEIESFYTKFGFEIGRLYITGKNGKTHSFSIAPTYTDISYHLRDGSGNNVGWTSYDEQKRQHFYEMYPDTHSDYLGGWGVTFNYNYQFIGIDINISKRVVEVSLSAQFDMNPWIHNIIRSTFN